MERDLGGGGGGAGEGGLFVKHARFLELKAFLSSDKGLWTGADVAL